MATTAELGAEVDAVRSLLLAAFDDFSEPDWAHCLGGVHALSSDERGLVGHAALVPRRFRLDGRVLEVGYVEGMAVRSDARRRGHGAALLAALEAWGGPRFDLLALSATDDGAALYAARGWTLWTGRTAVLRRGAEGASAPPDDEGAHVDGGQVQSTPWASHIKPTPDDDGAIFLRAARLALPDAGVANGPLICDDRAGDPW